MGITNSYFNIYMSLFRFINSLPFEFETFFHDVVKLSPAMQTRIAESDRFGYVYCRVMEAAPEQITAITYHLTGKDMQNPGLAYWLKAGAGDISDAFRTRHIPFYDVAAVLSPSSFSTFMSTASIDAISTALTTIRQPHYHNGEMIEFYLASFGAIEDVDTDGSVGVAMQIELHHYAPDNIAPLRD